MDLYSDIILELNKNPPNYRVSVAATHELKAYNSYCGDKYKLHLDYADGANDVSFEGHGCAVSKASAAILTQCVEGKSWNEIRDMCQAVLEFLKGDRSNVADIDDRLEAFAVVRKYPGRYNCAALCWEEMQKYCLLQISNVPLDRQDTNGTS
jgi:nitrogen fixation NifU-like protein